MRITLTQPVQAHGEPIASLTLREPRGEDIQVCGYPFLLLAGEGEEVGVRIDAAAIGKYVSRLAGVPTSSVRALCLADWQACLQAVLSFFGDMASAQAILAPLNASSSTTSTSPGSGESAPPKPCD